MRVQNPGSLVLAFWVPVIKYCHLVLHDGSAIFDFASEPILTSEERVIQAMVMHPAFRAQPVAVGVYDSEQPLSGRGISADKVWLYFPVVLLRFM